MKYFFFIYFALQSALLAAQNPAHVDTLLVHGVRARNNKEFTKSLELLTEARSIAEENQWYRQEFLAINNIGANYYSMLDYGEALDNYLEAYTIAIKRLDENEEMIVLNNIAILYSKENDLAKAEEYFKKAYMLANESKDQMKVGLYAVNLGVLANQQNQLDIASKYLNEAMENLGNQPEIKYLAELAIAENQYRRKNYELAKATALQVLPNIQSLAFIEEKITVLVLLSNIYLDMGDVSTALDYAQSALGTAIDPETRISAFNQLAKVYRANADMDNALQAKDSVISLTDSLNQMKNGRFFETNKVKFEISNYRRELQQNKEKQVAERNMLYALLGILLLVICLIAWALRNSFIKNKQRKILHNRSKEIIELELQKKKSDNLVLEKQLHTKEALALLEQEKLKNEIDTRNRKLAAKALQISSRNELLKDIINSLSSQSEITRNQQLSKKIKELKSLLKSDSEWENFFTHFEEVNHNFISELKKRHPELTANDIRYLSYLYMDLTNKEISSLFNITVEASRKRKERISTKMGLADSSNLYHYISTI
ncbi:tetratricopeptide repeat protein [Aequorivita echinoideorum]|uniref:Tetratricopeptide repeat protein n=1 Tax=Aequorivita echinoideorum TaxID=1549647 RepID=A0ABS5S0G4_9FLAO|nr:tetratricopeptide repeat protein [Aequorivita echinoideorum]MBT0606709.1 tetratricopeptide repeat protein [Aequorivita echinoideorum]